MPREVTDAALIAQLEGGQSAINRAATPAAGGPVRPPTAPQAMAMQQRAANLKALASSYADLKGLYGKTLKGVGPSSLLEFLPTPSNKAFDSAAAGMSDIAFGAFRVPGAGAQSDADQRNFIRANEPHAADYDATIEAKLANIRNRLAASGVPIPGEATKEGFQIVGRRRR